MAGVIFSIVTIGIRNFLRIMCRVDDAELDKLPPRGPLIAVMNHVNFMDAPMLYTHLQPRPLTAFAKTETWDNPLTGKLFDLWEIIPLRRGEVDLNAFRLAAEALHHDKIVGVAPEGTRSGSGRLNRGYPGVVLLALRSGAPLQPIVCYGHENIWQNLPHLRRTDFHLAVGNPFKIDTKGEDMTRELRQKITDEIMYQIAALLPEAYRGIYGDLSLASEKYLCFDQGVESNLLRAALVAA